MQRTMISNITFRHHPGDLLEVSNSYRRDVVIFLGNYKFKVHSIKLIRGNYFRVTVSVSNTKIEQYEFICLLENMKLTEEIIDFDI